MLPRPALWILTIAALVASPAAAQPGDPEAPEDSLPETDTSLSLRSAPGWAVRIEPMIWAPSLGGDFMVGGPGRIDAEWINADEVNLSPAGRLTIAADAWRFRFDGFAISGDDDERVRESFTADGVAFARGTDVEVDLDLAVFTLTAGREVWRKEFAEHVALALDLYGGARLIDMDLSLTNNSGAEIGGEGTWIEPLAGFGVAFDLPHGFDLRFTLDGGPSLGDDIGFDWQVTSSFGWRFMDNAGLEVGFRHYSMDLNDDDLSFDGWAAGLFGSVVIYF